MIPAHPHRPVPSTELCGEVLSGTQGQTAKSLGDAQLRSRPVSSAPVTLGSWRQGLLVLSASGDSLPLQWRLGAATLPHFTDIWSLSTPQLQCASEPLCLLCTVTASTDCCCLPFYFPFSRDGSLPLPAAAAHFQLQCSPSLSAFPFPKALKISVLHTEPHLR